VYLVADSCSSLRRLVGQVDPQAQVWYRHRQVWYAYDPLEHTRDSLDAGFVSVAFTEDCDGTYVNGTPQLWSLNNLYTVLTDAGGHFERLVGYPSLQNVT
jgi:hypothetical protein